MGSLNELAFDLQLAAEPEHGWSGAETLRAELQQIAIAPFASGLRRRAARKLPRGARPFPLCEARARTPGPIFRRRSPVLEAERSRE